MSWSVSTTANVFKLAFSSAARKDDALKQRFQSDIDTCNKHFTDQKTDTKNVFFQDLKLNKHITEFLRYNVVYMTWQKQVILQCEILYRRCLKVSSISTPYRPLN